jgi:hypothetical protein
MHKSFTQLSIVVILTAFGHLLAVSLYPIAARHISPQDLVSIGLIDSTMMMILALLGFGLNATATRDIALTTDWRVVLKVVQSARVSLSFLCFLFGVTWITYSAGAVEVGLVMLAAPILALNYDFVLYGLGKPVHASIVSFIRQSFPLVLFLLMIFFNNSSPYAYFALLLLFIFVASILVSKFAAANLFFSPNPRFYVAYISARWVGLAGLFIIFQRFGFLSFIGDNLPQEDFILLATSLKFLLLVVASKRIIIQVFYTKLVNDSVCKKINILVFTLSLLSLIVSYILSEELSIFIFNRNEAEDYILLIALGACSILSFAVSDSKLLLQRKDKWMFMSNLICGTVFILCVYLGQEYFSKGIYYLYLLIATELLLAISYRLGLTSLNNNKSDFNDKHRLKG